MSEQTFTGFEAPGTTPVSDYVFDFLLKELTGNELKVLMYIIRRTFGFGKNADAISLSQFREGMKTKDGKVLNVGCGIGHNRLILVALTSLEQKGYVVSEKREAVTGSKDTTIYKLRFKKAEQVVTPSNEVVTSGNQGGSYFSTQGVVTSGNIQETHVTRNIDEESVSTPTLPQPEITHTTFSDAELIALCQQRGITFQENPVSPDYTTSTTIQDDETCVDPSMQLSTQANTNVDKSPPSTQPSHSRRATSQATHVGVAPVLAVPVPPRDGEVTPPSVKPAQTPAFQAPRLLHSKEAITVSAMYERVAGPGGYAKWDWEAMETMGAKGVTEEDIKLVFTHLESKGMKRNVEQVWLNWVELPTLKNPTARRTRPTGPSDNSYHPELETDETRAARDAKNKAALEKIKRMRAEKEKNEQELAAKRRAN